MPRPSGQVKTKRTAPRAVRRTAASQAPRVISPGAIDLHHHGAFGIDLVTATAEELGTLSEHLAAQGVAVFLPTLLSLDAETLAAAVGRLGAAIVALRASPGRGGRSRPPSPVRALPLGLHLEGPWIDTTAAGAHPPTLLRDLDWAELERLWQLSQGTLKRITLSPRRVPRAQWGRLVAWADERQITLSLGHSSVDTDEARAAFAAGWRSVTHLWNAMPFHHRAPGIVGALACDHRVDAEVILDGIHVHPSTLRLTLEALGVERVFAVSDCVPAAGLPVGERTPFGDLEIELATGADPAHALASACYCSPLGAGLAGKRLAGGAVSVVDAWVSFCASQPDQQAHWRTWLKLLTTSPLRSLRLSRSERESVRVAQRRIRLAWTPPRAQAGWRAATSALQSRLSYQVRT